MTRITLFTATIGDGSARLSISVVRNFDSADPFTVALGGDNWPLAVWSRNEVARVKLED